MSQIVDMLVEMGFQQSRAELAILRSSAKDVQEAMEWLLANEESEEPPETLAELPSSSVVSTENVEEKANSEVPEKELSEAQDPEAEPKSIKCDDCGKLFGNQTEVEYHAVKTGHKNFSQSAEEKKPLSDEEKKEQLAKIEAKLKQRRLEREEREKLEELEKEKNRIRSGKDMLEAKRKQEDAEIKKVIEQRKREKQEEKLARDRVKAQIEQDRLARKARFGDKPTESVMQQPTSTTTPVTNVKTEQQNYQEVKLQIRLTNGNALTQTFGAKEPLSAVRLFVEINRTDEPGPFVLRTSFPAKVFKSDDYDKPLDLLGLAPSSVLIVSKT